MTESTLTPDRSAAHLDIKRRDTRPRPATLLSSKIHAQHLERLAIVYVRQSSTRQVEENIESTQMQYQLVDRATALGWSRNRVDVIDDDLGVSGRSIEGRIGFQRLLAEVSLEHVGLVLGIEMSRLARSCRDWHQLLELCAVFGTLLGDADGIYDPRERHQRGQASLIASLALCGYDFAFLGSNITCREHREPTKQADFITCSIAETCERIFFAKTKTLPRSNEFCMKAWRSTRLSCTAIS